MKTKKMTQSESYKQTSRQQWARNLKGSLKGTIPFAVYLAQYFDSMDLDAIDQLLFSLMRRSSACAGWERILDTIREWEANIGDEKDFDGAVTAARKNYQSLANFKLAKEEMVITFLMNEYSPIRNCSD
jgi:hypothetical protein